MQPVRELTPALRGTNTKRPGAALDAVRIKVGEADGPIWQRSEIATIGSARALAAARLEMPGPEDVEEHFEGGSSLGARREVNEVLS